MSQWEEDGDTICDRCGDTWYAHLVPVSECPGPLTDAELDERDGDRISREVSE